MRYRLGRARLALCLPLPQFRTIQVHASWGAIMIAGKAPSLFGDTADGKNAFPEALGAAAGVALVAAGWLLRRRRSRIELWGNLSRLSLHEYYKRFTFST
jgi:uncharacterized protein (TIGR03382 family)